MLGSLKNVPFYGYAGSGDHMKNTSDKAVKSFARILELPASDTLVQKLSGSLSSQRLEGDTPELFHACRMVREGKGAEYFRVAIKIALKARTEHLRQEAVERVALVSAVAFQRHECAVCGGQIETMFLKSHKKHNYSLMVKCLNCKLVIEICSGSRSLLVKRKRA